MGITTSPTLAMARSWVPNPVFKPMPTPAAGSIGFSSAGSTLSNGYVSGSREPCVVGFGARVLGFISDWGHAKVRSDEVPEFLDPCPVKTDMVVCKRQLVAKWVVRLGIMRRSQISSPAVVKLGSVYGVVGRSVSVYSNTGSSSTVV